MISFRITPFFKRLAAICVAALLLTGCDGAGQQSDSDFPLSVTLTCREKPMGAILKPGSLFTCGKYVLLQDNYRNSDYHFAVFSRRLEYLYSFCKRGNGPEECLMPSPVRNVQSDICIIRDHGNDRFSWFELTDSCAIFRKSVMPPSAGAAFPFEINMVSPDRLLLRNTGFHTVRRQLWDIKRMTPIDTLPPTFDYERRLGRDFHPEYDDYRITTDGKRFMCAYFFQNCLEFGSIEADHMKITVSRGSTDSHDLYWFDVEPTSDKYKYNSDFNTVYYEWIASGLDSFWASCAGVEWGALPDHHADIIERFSLDGKPEVRYRLSKPVESFVVLPSPRRIVAINPDLTDDSFLIFNL